MSGRPSVRNVAKKRRISSDMLARSASSNAGKLRWSGKTFAMSRM